MNTSRFNQHLTVMLNTAIDNLVVKPNGIYVDGTFGCGGHTKLILEKLNNHGKLLVIDVDPNAINLAKQLQQQDPRLQYYHGSFKNLNFICDHFGFTKLDGVLLDLGVSSPQLDDPARGFSFNKNGPLDLRMDPTTGISAKEWLQHVSAKELSMVLKTYGQEQFANKIAMAIVDQRVHHEINTTLDLAKIIINVYPKARSWQKHPATKTFQAIRIYLNQELLALEQVLPQIINLLNVQARLVCISFHSLEDTIVKNFIVKASCKYFDSALRKLPIHNYIAAKPILKDLGKFKPTPAEILANPRSRSAIMRVAEKCA